jgi:hypothetical protein
LGEASIKQQIIEGVQMEEREDNLSDIVFNDNEKSDKTKKIIFLAIILAVLGLVIYVLATSFSAEEENLVSSGENPFVEDNDPFFMDTPADTLSNGNSFGTDNGNDFVAENGEKDDIFSKEALLNSDETAEEPTVSSIKPAVIQPNFSNEEEKNFDSSVKETSLMSSPENENSSFQTNNVDTLVKEANRALTKDRQYYIQTGTFFKLSPNKKFLTEIENLGLSYHLDVYVKDSQNITRVLVGPFDTKSGANEALLTVREKLVKDAYVLRTRLH